MFQGLKSLWSKVEKTVSELSDSTNATKVENSNNVEKKIEEVNVKLNNSSNSSSEINTINQSNDNTLSKNTTSIPLQQNTNSIPLNQQINNTSSTTPQSNSNSNLNSNATTSTSTFQNLLALRSNQYKPELSEFANCGSEFLLNMESVKQTLHINHVLLARKAEVKYYLLIIIY
eukprot:TRINITY_DN3413_c0_g1_i1.p1 TRINITY_DN3413_c0_g1~~TRINITY_DN3413_c0_g1_i1.p1  ORF type:complete len:174 (+),score=76.25 TRINITY_DN3413_c0_g1_i1:72-593(+)